LGFTVDGREGRGLAQTAHAASQFQLEQHVLSQYLRAGGDPERLGQLDIPSFDADVLDAHG
jgi:hypothetical protein